MHDAIVIGAGPAGCAAAITLSKLGMKTALVEKSAAARHKVCGEFFSPGVWPLFQQLGIEKKMLSGGGRPVWGASLFFPLKGPIHVDFPEICEELPFAFALSRFTFDRLLLQRAAESGCEIITGNEVLSAVEEDGGCSVKRLNGTVLKAKQIVIAAGRTHRFKKQKPGGTIGFKTHFQNAKKPSGLEMYFFRGGYLGLLEIERGKINLCGMLDPKLLKECGGNFENVLRHAAEKNAALRTWLSSAIRVTAWLSCVTPNGFQGKNTRRIFYTGDSACFVEPMIGQGMTLALASGIQTAEKLAGKIQDAPKKIYQSKLDFLRGFGPMSRICSRFPSLARPWARLFLKERALEKLLATP